MLVFCADNCGGDYLRIGGMIIAAGPLWGGTV